ncbi:MAG: 2,3-bisphosphoglycerate-independent phosphoglycerate mutase [Ilumatobacteraceae bacterium]
MPAAVNSASAPLVLAILDGVGLADPAGDNALTLAHAPFLHRAIGGDLAEGSAVSRPIAAHGTAVGLPSDADMGNSEVGHNIMGAGRIFDQGAKQVEAAFESGTIWGDTWGEVMARRNAQIHFIGLLSDGNVHSHIRHLETLLARAVDDGARHLVCHVLFDGRDVTDGTAEKYLKRLEDAIERLTEHAPGVRIVIGSGGGRMCTTMDRYEADWDIVERGWRAHAAGSARGFTSAGAALAALRSENPGVSDQYHPEFTVVDADGRPVGAMDDGDAVVLFNFRGDRMIEICRALTEHDFDAFDRGPLPENLLVVGMTLYDGDLGIPSKFLVQPTTVVGTVSEVLADAGIAQFACAETQKFGHVTYFWNGNRSDKFNDELETYLEIPSDKVPFDQLPRMKAKETGEAVVGAIATGRYAFIRCNFAGGDMVGHTGSIPASVIAVEAIDEALVQINDAVRSAGGTLVITADHGNCEVLVERDAAGNPVIDAHGEPVPKKSHTLSAVPFVVVDYSGRVLSTNDVASPGISNVAATLLLLLGHAVPAGYRPPLVSVA